MTVVHINIGLGGGGAEHILLELAKKGNQDGVKTIIISISNINVIEHKLKEQNTEYHYLNINSVISFFKGLNKLHTIITPLNNTVLHCHMFHGLMMGVFYNLRYKKIPIIFTLHNILVEHRYRRFLLFFTKPLRKVDINFSKNSNKWYSKPVTIIANGVDFERFHISKERNYIKNKDKFIFLFLGRIEAQKNPLYLIDIVSNLIKYGKKNFVIHIAGDGNMRTELEQLISENEYSKYIKILGFQNNVKQVMEQSHCLILPSLWEGLPVSLIEASANKLPIISTPVGSIPEYFNDTNSYVADLKLFHVAMNSVIDNYEQAIIRSEKLFKDNRNIFDIDVVYEKHKLLYTKYSKNSIK